MKSLFIVFLILLSGVANARLLSCETRDIGESNGRLFSGEIFETSKCSSGYGIKVHRSKACVLAHSSTTIYSGLVRGCGYHNGNAFVVTDVLPLGAE